MPDHDVIVVGAGPAGAITAYYLARGGLDVAILERKTLPRYKPCGGGISGRTRAELPFAIDAVLEREIDGIAFNLWGHSLVRRHDRPIAWMSMRDRFDHYLTAQAVEAGASLHQQTTMTGDLRLEPAAVIVPTSRGDLRARLVIGADGAPSRVARSAGLMPRIRSLVALEHEIHWPASRAAEWSGLVELDFESQPWGYGWVFPKADHLSVGLAITPQDGPRIRDDLGEYRQRRRLGEADAPTTHREGHKIPSRHPGDPVHGDRVLLVGDAAGLADEFSAEGIFYAVTSARLAAGVAQRWVRGEASLAEYSAIVDRTIMPELAAARGISNGFFALMRRAPRLTTSAVRAVDYYTRTLFEVQAAQTSYVDIQAKWPLLRPIWQRLNAAPIATR